MGSLVGLGVSDEDAAYYDEEFRKGRTIVVVKSADRADVAATILRNRNSQNLHLNTPQTLGDQTESGRL